MCWPAATRLSYNYARPEASAVGGASYPVSVRLRGNTRSGLLAAHRVRRPGRGAQLPSEPRTAPAALISCQPLAAISGAAGNLCRQSWLQSRCRAPALNGQMVGRCAVRGVRKWRGAASGTRSMNSVSGRGLRRVPPGQRGQFHFSSMCARIDVCRRRPTTRAPVSRERRGYQARHRGNPYRS